MFYKKNAQLFLSCSVSLHPISITQHPRAVWKEIVPVASYSDVKLFN